MVKTRPEIAWFEGTQDINDEVVGVIDYGTVDADSDSLEKTFFIWNNRNSPTEAAPKMEQVVFTTRDRDGGIGNTPGNIVEAVRDNWFQVRVDSLGESNFTEVGSGIGLSGGKTGEKLVGTNGTTINPNATTATPWTNDFFFSQGLYVKPTVSNQFIYKVVTAGTSGGTEPNWATVDNQIVTDGTVEYITIRINQTPQANEILGVENSVATNGSNADQAGGNFIRLTVFASVPLNASAGKNELFQRLSYRYTS